MTSTGHRESDGQRTNVRCSCCEDVTAQTRSLHRWWQWQFQAWQDWQDLMFSACHRSQLLGRWLFSHWSIHLKWSKVNKSFGSSWYPEQVRQEMQKLCVNYTWTVQKLCRGRSESRTAFLKWVKWESVMPARLSMSISANRDFVWNQNATNQVEAKAPAAFFSALVFAAAVWKARSERAPQLKHGFWMPSFLNVSKCLCHNSMHPAMSVVLHIVAGYL